MTVEEVEKKVRETLQQAGNETNETIRPIIIA
jgi:hypothetical protein